jgi:hypothetical protein
MKENLKVHLKRLKLGYKYPSYWVFRLCDLFTLFEKLNGDISYRLSEWGSTMKSRPFGPEL